MTVQQLVGMAARLFAIYLLLIAFQMFGIVSALVENGAHPPPTLYLMPLLPVAVALVLWTFPMLVAHKLVPRTQFTDTMNLPARQLVAAAAAIIGIWALVNALPNLGALFGIAISSEPFMMRAFFDLERTMKYTGIALQCAAGLFLVCRPWVVADKILS